MARYIHGRPLRLIFDFDGTITLKDTMHIIAKVGYGRQKELARVPQPRPWNEIVDAYMIDFKSHLSLYRPATEDRTSPKLEIAWLDSLKPIEDASMKRALQAGIFDHVRELDLSRAAQDAIDTDSAVIRPGWVELCVAVCKHNSNLFVPDVSNMPSLHVLSVNWSATFIKHILSHIVQKHPDNDAVTNLPVYANELPSIITNPQSEALNLRTSGDKARIISKRCQVSSKNEQRRRQQEPVSVYVGDSVTDLECLIIAEIGICIQDKPMSRGQQELAQTCQRIGIKILPLSELANLQHERTSSLSKCLYYTDSFADVRDQLLCEA